jgi:hypothetical protein
MTRHTASRAIAAHNARDRGDNEAMVELERDFVDVVVAYATTRWWNTSGATSQ